MREIWKPIVWYEGRYEVSSLGRVRIVKSGKIMSPFSGGSGGLKVSLWDGSRKTNWRIAVLVADAFIPNPLGLRYVIHKDGDPMNDRVDNIIRCEANKRPDEEWRPVTRDGYCDLYEVSSLGRLRRLKHQRLEFLSPILSNRGTRLLYHLRNNENGITIRAEELVADAFIQPSSGKYIRFLDGNKYNCSAYNLLIEDRIHQNGKTRKICVGRTKPVQLFKNGEYITTFNKAGDAARYTGISYVFVSACINGKIPEYNGYEFKVVQKGIQHEPQ